MGRSPQAIVVALFTLLVPVSSDAQQTGQRSRPTDVGRMEYVSKCASCHGLRGKGDGVAGRSFKAKPADLTKLAAKNGGVLPISSMYDMIIGDKKPAVHGSRDMPVWGPVYAKEAAAHYFDTPEDREAYVRARVLFLIEYINRIQTK